MILIDKSDLQQTHEVVASLNPEEYQMIPFSKDMVMAVDNLVRLAHEHISPNKIVESDNDWKVVEGIFKTWAMYCPKEYKDFAKSQKQVRQGLFNSMAVTKDKGGGQLQHQLNLPLHFDAMMRAIYPNQKWTKKFIQQIAKRFPIMRVPERL